MNNETDGSERISCQGCRHYKITWEPRSPYACRAHGFKAACNPALAVFQASGIKCQLFSPRKKPRENTDSTYYA